jgi:cytochrome P450
MSAALELSSLTPKPGHIPDRLVYDFDLRADPGLLANPHARVLDLIKNAPPIFWTPRNGGSWYFTSHEAIFNAARDTENFSNSYMPPETIKALLAMRPADAPFIPIPVPIGMDPPDHTKFRAPLNGAFSPKVMNALKADIRALADRLLDRIALLGRSEFMIDVAEPMPVQVFLKMMGLPIERQAEYRALVKENMDVNATGDIGKSVEVMMKINHAMHDVIIERKDKPESDLISLLWATKVDDQHLSLEDMYNYCVLLFVAGLDTVMNGIGLGVHHLATNPELQRELRAKPELVAEATEEMLRRYTFTVPPRRVAKDVTFLGVDMKENERALLFLPAADLDAKEFPNPDEFSLGREKKAHIAFNAGPHRCVGSHLARIELQILYEQLLLKLPEFRLDPDKAPMFHGGNVIGVETLNLVWDI